MEKKLSYHISPLGDSALLIDFGNVIDESVNRRVLSLFNELNDNHFKGLIEAVPAYSSLAVYYDVYLIKKQVVPGTTVFDWVCEKLKEILSQEIKDISKDNSLINVPVCYENEFAPDMEWLAEQNKISIEEIIHLHSAGIYRVYMLGFLPGFAYMASVSDKIASPRKKEPKMVEAGSVGIAGTQTGIYPLRSPGGWQIIGRTPLELFTKDKEDSTLFKPGNTVQFYSITKHEFEDIKNRSFR